MRDVWGVRAPGNDSIFTGLCRKFIMASILYYRHDFSPTTDAQFDNWALTLRMKYHETPAWFRERVSYGDLVAGTGFALVPTEEEQALASEFLTGSLNPDHYF